MAKPSSKLALSISRDIPFNKLVLSQSNVRRVKASVAIEELAEDIARRTLLQGLTVRSVLDDDGNDTGMYEIPAGGRRYRALELLVKKKRLARNAPIPCIVRTEAYEKADGTILRDLFEPDEASHDQMSIFSAISIASSTSMPR
jgi:ParB-like chromosome segregation protein Spo0J